LARSDGKSFHRGPKMSGDKKAERFKENFQTFVNVRHGTETRSLVACYAESVLAALNITSTEHPALQTCSMVKLLSLRAQVTEHPLVIRGNFTTYWWNLT
jgi:hypothetical protein